MQVVAAAVLLRRHQMLRSRLWPAAAEEELHAVKVEGSRAVSNAEEREACWSACLLRRLVMPLHV